MLAKTSNKDSIIFVHIFKTGGVSVGNLLNSFAKLTLNKSHHTIFQLRDLIQPDIFDEAFKFSIVRNPWDRAVSTFFFRQKSARSTEERERFFINGIGKNKKGFNDWIKKISGNLDKAKATFPDSHRIVPFHIGNCLDWISYNDKVLVDKIYKFEHLDELETDLNKFGQFNLPHLNSSELRKGQGYHHYYNDDSREFIEHVCSKDIDMFDYKFEEK